MVTNQINKYTIKTTQPENVISKYHESNHVLHTISNRKLITNEKVNNSLYRKVTEDKNFQTPEETQIVNSSPVFPLIINKDEEQQLVISVLSRHLLFNELPKSLM